jgi:c(7)-type cytochrome triheme protein
MMRTRAAPCLALVALVTLLPIPGVAAEVGDIVFTRKEAGTEDIPPAIFPHWAHRMQFKCHVCHDTIVAMKAGANPISMEAIQQGKYCGVCHDGKTAFQATFETCARCHRQ